MLASPACVMVWQRAFWRHTDTPRPALRVLIETFRAWWCSDVRDRVYGLLALADDKTKIVADYSKTVAQVYRDVCASECLGIVSKAPEDVVSEDARFRKALKEILTRSDSTINEDQNEN